MIGPCRFCKPHEEQGARLERRRIRRVTGPMAKMLRLHGEGCDDSSEGKWFAMLADELIAATRTQKRRK